MDLVCERLTTLDEHMISPASSHFDGMPRRSGVKGDRLSGALVKKEELEYKIQKLASEQEEKRKLYERYLDLLKADEGAVLLFRYIDGLPWSTVSSSLFGQKDDFEDREESYMRRTFKLHGRALLHLADILEEEGLINAEA